MKKRLTVVLFGLALTLGMMLGMSSTAYAETSPYTNLIPTNSDDATALANKVVKFGGVDYGVDCYIIADNSSNQTAPTITLLAKDPLVGRLFNGSKDYKNKYSSSSANIAASMPIGEGGVLESVADKIAAIPSLTTYAYGSTDVYDTAKNVKLYLLSTEEAERLPEAVRKCAKHKDSVGGNKWWLRSPGRDDTHAAYVDGDSGGVRSDGEEVTIWLGIRPAFKVDLTKVAFDSETKTFTEPTGYKLWVGGVEVTSSYLSGKGWSYNPTDKVLTLDGYDSSNNSGTYCLSSDYFFDIFTRETLTIELRNKNTIRASSSDYTKKACGIGIYNYQAADKDLTITGNGTLEINCSSYGIYAQQHLQISGGTINIEAGKSGIFSDMGHYQTEPESVTISGGAVVANGGVRLHQYAHLKITGGSLWAKDRPDGSQAISGGIAEGNARQILLGPGMEGLQSKDGIAWEQLGNNISIPSAQYRYVINGYRYAKIKQTQPNPPAAPTIKSITTTTVELNPVANCEYRHSGSDTWQESPVLTGLDSGTSYTFYQRYKEDAIHHASPESGGTPATTIAHNHELSYAVESGERTSAIVATCANSDGGHKGNTVARLTLTAPTMIISGREGNSSATVEGLASFNAVTGLNISDVPIQYYKATRSGDIYSKNGGVLGAVPTDPGDYIAEITAEGKTASVGYTFLKSYDLWVGNTLVTNANAAEILGDGSAVYDGETGTLTLKDYKGSGSVYADEGATYTTDIFYNGSEKLKINLVGENAISNAVKGYTHAIYSTSGVEITGTGSLSCSGTESGLYCGQTLELTGTANVNCTGVQHGIDCNALVVDGAKVVASSTQSDDTLVAQSSGIKAKTKLTVKSGDVTASGYYGLICAEEATEETQTTVGHTSHIGSMTIENGVVTATGTHTGFFGDVTVSGGEMRAIGGEGEGCYGINTGRYYSNISGGVQVSGGTLNTETSSLGIKGRVYVSAGTVDSAEIDGHLSVSGGVVNVSGPYAVKGEKKNESSVNVSGGTVMLAGDSYAIYGDTYVNNDKGLEKFIVSSSTNGQYAHVIDGEVYNWIPGVGWKGDGTRVSVNKVTGGQSFPGFNRLLFQPHFHSFAYVAGTGEEANTITATCNIDNYDSQCPLHDSDHKPIPVTLTISAPALTQYGGTEGANAIITDKHHIQVDASGVENVAEVRYYRTNAAGTDKAGDPLSGAPTDMGTYWAEVTLGPGHDGKTATAHVVYTIAGASISSVAVTDIAAPEAAAALDATATTGTANVTLGNSGAITWSPAAPEDGKAAYATAYTATVTVAADENHVFADNVTATVNGQAATVAKNDDGTLAISYTFDKTVLNPVAIEAAAQEVAYSADGNAIPAEGMFTIPANAGAATYAVTPGTGAGAYDAQTGKLTVTKCGTFTVAVNTAATETHAAANAEATLTVKKADPVAEAPSAFATYGQTLSAVQLSNPEGNTAGTWTWVDSTQSVGSVVSPAVTFKANFTPENGELYNSVANVDVTVTVAKADPIANVPTTASATYGQTLADVALSNPDGNTSGTWSWVDDTLSVGDAGTNTFQATFTPSDTNNYNSATGVGVSVSVSKAQATDAMKAATVSLVAVSGRTATVGYDLPTGASYGAASNANTSFYTVAVDASNGLVLTAAKNWTEEEWADVATKTFTVPIAGATNYEDYTLTVTVSPICKKVQTITAGAVSATYGDTNKVVGASVTSGDGAISYAVKEGSGEFIDVDASSGALTIRKAPAGGVAYVIATAAETDECVEAMVEIAVTINRATVTITASDQSIYLGDEIPDLSNPVEGTHYVVAGLVGNDALTTAPALSYQSNGTGVTPNSVASGTYDIVPSGASAGENYEIAYVKGLLTVSEKPDAIVATAPVAKVPTFTGFAQELVNAGASDSGMMHYALGSDEATAPSSGWGESIPTGTDVGTYYVWYKAVGDAAHNDGMPACVKATIAPAGISQAAVALSQTSFTYDGKAKTPAVKSVTLNGKTLRGGADYTVSYANNVKVGIATVTVTGKGNYTGAAKATFVIKAAPTPTPTPKPTPTPTPTPKPTPAPAAKAVDMHRMYNPNSGEHFYTASIKERDTLIGLGWNYEGLAWVAPATSKSPVYRMYNPNSGDHHYTLAVRERDSLIGVGWNYEGVGWYSDDAKGTPLYRQFNPNAVVGTHNYTTSKAENDHLASFGWHAEGIAWYGVRAASAASAKAPSGAQASGPLAAASL